MLNPVTRKLAGLELSLTNSHYASEIDALKTLAKILELAKSRDSKRVWHFRSLREKLTQNRIHMIDNFRDYEIDRMFEDGIGDSESLILDIEYITIVDILKNAGFLAKDFLVDLDILSAYYGEDIFRDLFEIFSSLESGCWISYNHDFECVEILFWT